MLTTKKSEKVRKIPGNQTISGEMVDLRGIEPLTSRLRTWRSPS